MKIFQSIREFLESMGVFQPQLFQQHPFNSRNIVMICHLGQYSILNATFFLIKADTFNEYAESLYDTATVVLTFAGSLIITWKSVPIFELIKNFETTIQNRLENPESKMLYEQANRTSEEMAKMFSFSLKASIPCALLPNLFKTLFNYITMDDESDIYHLPFPIWSPIDVNTPIGYLVCYCIEFSACYCMVLFFGCYLSLLVGSCKMLTSFVVDLKNEFLALNEINQDKEGRLKLKDRLSEIIQFHSIIKEHTSQLGQIYKILIMNCFLWSISTICCTLLKVQVELSHNTGNPMELIQSLTLSFWSFAFVFFFCNYGESVTNQFSELNDAVYGCDWYSFPIEVRRMLPTILIVTQQPVILKAFGNIPCTRETFMDVTKGGFSYFTTLREFGN